MNSRSWRAFSRFARALLTAICLLGVWRAGAQRVTAPFDAGWRFFKDDAPGAEKPAFNDSNWRVLNVPHDWSIEGPFAQTNRTGGGGGFLPGGVGWYRKEF